MDPMLNRPTPPMAEQIDRPQNHWGGIEPRDDDQHQPRRRDWMSPMERHRGMKSAILARLAQWREKMPGWPPGMEARPNAIAPQPDPMTVV